MIELSSTIEGFQTKPLVGLSIDHKADSAELPPNKIEAAFRIPGYRGLWLDTRSWSREAANFYAARSARTPENLLNHVQRIMHHLRQKQSEGVYGALLDLFIVLKKHGRPLRARMLHYARPLLQDERFDRLHQLLDKDSLELDTLPPSQCSILSRGFSGSYRLVEKINATSEPGGDPLVESRSYMEYGQLDAARSVLEAAILDGSLQLEVHTDLIEIYRHSRDDINFKKIYPLLRIRQKRLLLLWQELNEFFKLSEL